VNLPWLAVAVVGIALTAPADDRPDPKLPPADRLAALQKEHKDAEAAYSKAVQALPDTPEGEKKSEELWKEFDKKQGERFLAAVGLAKADPKSDLALAALEWVLTVPRSYYLPAGKPALELAAEHHAANPKVGKIVAWVGYLPPEDRVESHAAAVALIRAVAEKNPDRTARGQAVMALAWQAKRKFAVAEYRRTADAEELAAAAEKAFEAVVKDYADCPRLQRPNARTLGEEAGQELFDLRHLRIGKAAPDIEGEDLDGLKFKLSEYRGKVVVLDFWGDW
jgi:hypothetical protein